MSNNIFKNLDKIIKSKTKRALYETMVELGLESSEEELQRQKANDLKPFRATKKKKTSDAVDEDADSEGKSDLIKVKKDDTPDISLKKITDQIDVLRSGRSLKDKEVKKELKDYFDRLSSNEKIALFAFLKGLSRIMATGTDGAEAAAPSEDPYSVKMDKKKEPKGKKPKKDDSSPIIVGESASKNRELNILRGNLK